MCIARQFSQNHLVWQYWRDIYKSDFYTFPKSIFEATNWKGLQWIDEANRRYLYGNGTRATETFHNFFDFSKESDLLKSNEQKYLKLPIDIQYHRVRYIKDFLAFVKLFSSTLFNKCVSFTAQKADSMVINIKKTLKPYIKRVIKK